MQKAIDKPASFDKLMSYIAGKPLDFPPGSRWSYANTGYILAGRIIEVVSHESYRHYVQTHPLDPTGMAHTFTVAEEVRKMEPGSGKCAARSTQVLPAFFSPRRDLRPNAEIDLRGGDLITIAWFE